MKSWSELPINIRKGILERDGLKHMKNLEKLEFASFEKRTTVPNIPERKIVARIE